MLQGLSEDLKATGHETTVLLDARIAALHPPLNADRTVQIATLEDVDSSIDEAVENTDVAYVVAPENSHILESIVDGIRERGAISLNGQSSAIRLAADKPRLEGRAKSLGLNFPKTETCSVYDFPDDIAELIEDKLGFPVIVKPAEGADCCGLSVVRTHKDVAPALAKVRAEASENHASIQEYIAGIPASVSLVCTRAEGLPLSLNLQEVTLAGPDAISSYDGGAVPFRHPLREEAFYSAKLLAESFSGLQGYIGVDFILSEDKATVMEINPRLTTSYVGLRRVAGFNIAQSILEAVTENELPMKLQTRGCACFSKLAVSKPETPNWRGFWRSSVIASPPFPLTENEVSYALVQSYGKTSAEAFYELSETKKRLLQISNGVD